MKTQTKETLKAVFVKEFFNIPKGYQYDLCRKDLIKAIDDIPGDEFKETINELKLYL